MKFLLMIHGDETGWDDAPEAEQQARREQYGAVAGRGEVLSARRARPDDERDDRPRPGRRARS